MLQILWPNKKPFDERTTLLDRGDSAFTRPSMMGTKSQNPFCVFFLLRRCGLSLSLSASSSSHCTITSSIVLYNACSNGYFSRDRMCGFYALRRENECRTRCACNCTGGLVTNGFPPARTRRTRRRRRRTAAAPSALLCEQRSGEQRCEHWHIVPRSEEIQPQHSAGIVGD